MRRDCRISVGLPPLIPEFTRAVCTLISPVAKHLANARRRPVAHQGNTEIP